MTMTKTTAIKLARSRVSDLSAIGDNYIYLTYDAGLDAWRESTQSPYHAAKAHRSQALIDAACDVLGIDAPIYDGGIWTDYI